MKTISVNQALEKINNFFDKHEKEIILFLFVINLFVRFFKLDTAVAALNIDEVAIGYSSWCLANFGTDRYLHSFPIYIQNFYGGQSPAYAYLLAPIVGIFGLNGFTVRIPNAIAYAVGYVYLYKITKKFSDKNTERIAAALIYIISPVIIFMSRIALDCNLMLPFTIISVYYMITAIESQKLKDFVIAAIWHGLTLYTYALSYILLPFYLLTIFILLIRSKQINLRKSLTVIGILILFAFPLIFQLYTNLFLDEAWNIGPVTFTKMSTQRSMDVGPQYIKRSLFDTFIIWIIKDNLTFSSEKFTNYHIISIPFLIVGLILTIKKMIIEFKEKKVGPNSVIILLTMSSIIGLAFVNGISVYRINIMYLPAVLYIAKGIQKLVEKTNKVVFVIMMAIYIGFFGQFCNYYYFTDGYANEYASEHRFATEPFTEELNWINEQKELKEKDVYIMGMDSSYLHTIFSVGNVDPHELTDYKDTENYSWNYVYSYKNYHIKPIKKYIDDAVYIIHNKKTMHYYDDEVIKEVKNKKQKKEFEYYSIYY